MDSTTDAAGLSIESDSSTPTWCHTLNAENATFMLRTTVAIGVIAATFAIVSEAQSQPVNIWPTTAPGSETWIQKEQVFDDTPLGTVVINVVTPTLMPYLPELVGSPGTGVVIAPGGAFVALAIELEGHRLAQWLQARGIAAFVLKYRTVEKRLEGIPSGLDMDEVGKYGIADGIQALRVVRQRAREWNILPDRVGFVGFSAGAMVTSGALVQDDVAARPNFAALIYGGPFGVMPAIPKTLPPMFLAWAQDDAVALRPIRMFHDALIAAGHTPDVHVFSRGGHGFGMKQQGTTSDHWVDAFYHWLIASGFARPALR